MNRFPFLIATGAFIAASAPAQQPVPLEQRAASALVEQRKSEELAAALERAANAATSRADRLAARQRAAAAQIDATEMRISSAETQLRLASAQLAIHRSALAREREPVRALLAGLALMGQQPPIIALAGGADAQDLVRMKLLLDTTMPVISRRSRVLAKLVQRGRALETRQAQARSKLIGEVKQLALLQQQFATLEGEARQAALSAGVAAIDAGDRVIAGRERIDRLGRGSNRDADALALAKDLADEPLLPRSATRAGTPDPRRSAPFAYVLPADADVIRGLGEISAAGVRSRGVAMATRRGALVLAPADGTVSFAGPFAGNDGVIAIDHGQGWVTLIVNAASDARVGIRVKRNQLVGRALGPLEVELSARGEYLSPAIIAGSSRPLSNGSKGR